VGGINLDHGSLVPPGHPPVGGGNDDDIYANIHDLYLALGGPAATDVHHNFVQRWNEASERERPDGAWPDAERAGRLPFPAALSPPAGATTVQITRTVRGRRYRDPTAAPGAAPFPIEGGERSVLEQYLAAVVAAWCGGARYQDIYVHAKAALVDDAWATVGSTNVANRSFYADTELNASLWDEGTARALRVALFGEHLDVDTAALDARAALALF